MIGYYGLHLKDINQLGLNCFDVKENIYNLCSLLIVKDKKFLPKELLCLYDTLEIPIILYDDIKLLNITINTELSSYLSLFSKYLQLNIDIEMAEEDELGHLLRVAMYAKMLASSLNFSKQEIKKIYIAALFHDIGKYLIPKEIIGKKDKLNKVEYGILKMHSLLARFMLNQFFDESIIDMIESHHERFMGNGYPSGKIPSIGAQIIGIADSYDAMVSNRVYGKSKSNQEALEELDLCTRSKEEGGKGVFYDPKLVKNFICIEK